MDRRSFLRGFLAVAAVVPIAKVAPTPVYKAAVSELYHQHDLYAELVAVTRKAFIPRLYVQMYVANPLLYALTHPEDGGGSSVGSG